MVAIRKKTIINQIMLKMQDIFDHISDFLPLCDILSIDATNRSCNTLVRAIPLPRLWKYSSRRDEPFPINSSYKDIARMDAKRCAGCYLMFSMTPLCVRCIRNNVYPPLNERAAATNLHNARTYYQENIDKVTGGHLTRNALWNIARRHGLRSASRVLAVQQEGKSDLQSHINGSTQRFLIAAARRNLLLNNLVPVVLPSLAIIRRRDISMLLNKHITHYIDKQSGKVYFEEVDWDTVKSLLGSLLSKK